jgi:anti-sigma factor RsiW
MVESLLPNYLDDELAEELAQQVQVHLIACRSCAWEVESIRQTLLALRQSCVGGRPSAEFCDRLLGELLRDHRAAAARQPQRVGAPPPAHAGGPPFVFKLGEEEADDDEKESSR